MSNFLVHVSKGQLSKFGIECACKSIHYHIVHKINFYDIALIKETLSYQIGNSRIQK